MRLAYGKTRPSAVREFHRFELLQQPRWVELSCAGESPNRHEPERSRARQIHPAAPRQSMRNTRLWAHLELLVDAAVSRRIVHSARPQAAPVLRSFDSSSAYRQFVQSDHARESAHTKQACSITNLPRETEPGQARQRLRSPRGECGGRGEPARSHGRGPTRPLAP